jgi:purine-binding chemotaxis protein CheW
MQRLKPFAEPTKPLTLKMPLPQFQPQVSVAETNIVEAKTDKTVGNVSGSSKDDAPTKAQEDIHLGGAVSAEAVDEPTQEIVDEPNQEVAKQIHPTTQWMENGRPSWAQERFECLLFSVGGLTLAVPLAELGSIYPLAENDELTPLFGQISWFMGLLTSKGNNIRTVNTAKVVMPERYQAAMADNFKYVISINGVDWGLAVDNVSSAVTLDPDDVRWRSQRSKRPWLAGTVVDHMCALLDVSQLANMFLEQDQNERR